ncbi:hypothetical protein THMIRHAM_15770 [Thiomicrorhabdus immobilis]|uniref:DUF3817 domain-containing protein n=1 Tax=Thiomicrorhabdus immobilis TaxID=2791037 RepID=A0ABM7MEG0_9GAMM|nr:DUF3817 domain-containing protein [Thiomicrorhabdus immobilis]BCN93792.1 hypothetical protein THMIRHAM_15770 [Thiomicrorhabdus immobilis]
MMKTLQTLSILEGSSLLLLLFVAVPMKRLAGVPEAVTIIGPIHGALFILFNLFIFYAISKLKLKKKYAAVGFIASLIPFGSFVYKAKVLSRRSAFR